jgi:hypothetical protein
VGQLFFRKLLYWHLCLWRCLLNSSCNRLLRQGLCSWSDWGYQRLLMLFQQGVDLGNEPTAIKNCSHLEHKLLNDDKNNINIRHTRTVNTLQQP